MKTVRNIILGIIFAFALFSCDNPVNLGNMLDLFGPEVNFTSPVPRKAVTAEFLLEGTVEDESGIKMLLIKVEKDRVELPRQWRHTAGWEISEDYGVTWRPFAGGVWEGDIFVVWNIPVDLTINGKQPEDGEYLFSATAWDKGGVSDDNSFKTLVLIIDNDPPKVNVINPLLFSRYINYNPVTDKFDDTELEDLRSLSDWRNPEYIGKFQTNSFPLQWNIEDNFNIWSFDLRFYELNVPIDNNPETPLPDDYIYRFHQNLPPAPPAPSPENYLKPNGSVTIPALDGSGSVEDGELKKQIKDKAVIRIVAVCYDSANNVTQEKTLGYFIYWPQADIPWITYSGDLFPPEYYIDHPASLGPFKSNIEDAFLIYPGRDIKAIAFHAQGVKEVVFSLYKLEPAETLDASVETLLQDYNSIKRENALRGNNTYSASFSWDFRPPPRSAFYVVKAEALSISGKKSEIASAVFKVQDISFPDFPKSVQPPALEPLFKHISSDSITINGIVSDATEIDSLCLVWINPQSKNAAAMAQLEYFRDSGYEGWMKALTLTAGGSYAEQGDYDAGNPNKVWKLAPSLNTEYPNDSFGINPETQRVEYNFSITIPLGDLNIGKGNNYLKSQVFLLRAENPDNRVTIITYTPQGDEAPPVIKITGVVITHDDNSTSPLTPGQFGQISKFNGGEKITINGTWDEDSVKYLPFNDYLKDNFNVSINQNPLSADKLSFTGITNSDTGTWKAEVTVGTDILLTSLKDTLVIAANLSDIGGNKSDDGASWLIESDTLRLVRISSDFADQTYNAGNAIEIFIEFNKPVRLKSGRNNPVLTLRVGNSTNVTARYNDGQSILNTKQYFTYTVAPGQDTTTAYPWLDVIGLNGVSGSNYWTAPDYPFTWEAVSGTGSEEIRITMETAHVEGVPSTGYLLRRLPVAANSGDSMYTLAKGKNIGIDTKPPTVDGIGSSNKAGHYADKAEIEVNIIFSEAVKIADESDMPQIRLKISNNSSQLVTTSGSPKVNNNIITFSYTVKVENKDTTGENKVIVDSFIGGEITDIAGNPMAAHTFNAANGALNGGTANNGTGIYVNTINPGVPTFKALSANNNSSVISNNLGTANSGAAGIKALENVYHDDLYFAVERADRTSAGETAGTNNIGYLEYSLDSGISWKRITNADGTDNITGAPFKQDIYGKYNVIARQTDKAGNISANSAPVSLNWDPGTLVTRIDSSSANGTYTNTGTNVTPQIKHSVNVTVYFRKPITTTGTPTIRLNVTRGANPYIDVQTVNIADKDQLSFTYDVENGDNTPAGTFLDVTDIYITATDKQNVTVSNFIKLPDDTGNRLGNRKEIQIQTGTLALQSGPTYTFTAANDEATGYITITFNRSILKKGGDITITQQSSGYRLPAVLTEAQANRYKSARNFNTYYSRGTNGSENGVVDTSTKYVLDYTETTVVSPNNTGSAQEQMAYDFYVAEKVTLPVSSQDVTVNLNTLTINLTGSNALQVLGAVYDIVIPVGLIQDGLGFQWPTSAMTYNHTLTGINRPFVRVDKKIDADRITLTTNGGAANRPHLTADFSNLIQTRARLDCRTPNSIVRYKSAGAEHTASAANSLGSGPQNPATTPGTPANYYWKNTTNNADSLTDLNGVAQQDTDSGTGTTSNYSTFTGNTQGNAGEANITHITVGTNTQEGYVWRIGVKSRNSGGSVNSALYEEIAFRSVLTYEVADGTGSTTGTTPLGQVIGSGDQLWIRGGDAIGSSSIPGFPLTWQDDYGKLNTEKKRAGARLMRLVNTPATNLYTAANWRYITWEINVQTFHDVVLGRGTAAGTAQNANDAWQYGPRQWAYQRGGWTALKAQYTINPGKHRWCRIANQGYDGGYVNFSLQFSVRGEQDISYPQP